MYNNFQFKTHNTATMFFEKWFILNYRRLLLYDFTQKRERDLFFFFGLLTEFVMKKKKKRKQNAATISWKLKKKETLNLFHSKFHQNFWNNCQRE